MKLLLTSLIVLLAAVKAQFALSDYRTEITAPSQCYGGDLYHSLNSTDYTICSDSGANKAYICNTNTPWQHILSIK